MAFYAGGDSSDESLEEMTIDGSMMFSRQQKPKSLHSGSGTSKVSSGSRQSNMSRKPVPPGQRKPTVINDAVIEEDSMDEGISDGLQSP